MYINPERRKISLAYIGLLVRQCYWMISRLSEVFACWWLRLPGLWIQVNVFQCNLLCVMYKELFCIALSKQNGILASEVFITSSLVKEDYILLNILVDEMCVVVLPLGKMWGYTQRTVILYFWLNLYTLCLLLGYSFNCFGSLGISKEKNALRYSS